VDINGKGLIHTDADAELVLREALRLLSLAHAKSRGNAKKSAAVYLLRFLVEPHRPKTREDHVLALELCRVVAQHFKAVNREGSATFLQSILLWLDGDEKRALRLMRRAAEFGRSSCSEDWIWLLRYAPILAEKLARKHDQNYFIKLANHEGVTHAESAPKTIRLLAELKQHDTAAKFRVTFKPFPK